MEARHTNVHSTMMIPSGVISPGDVQIAPIGRVRSHCTPEMFGNIVRYVDVFALLAANVALCTMLRLRWHDAAGGSLLLATAFGTFVMLRLLHFGHAYRFGALRRVRWRQERFISCFLISALPTVGALYLLSINRALAFEWLVAATCVQWSVFLVIHLAAHTLLRRAVRSGHVGYRVAVVRDGMSDAPELPIVRASDEAPPFEFVGCYGEAPSVAAPNGGNIGSVHDLSIRSRHEQIDAVLLDFKDGTPTAAHVALRTMIADIYIRDPLAAPQGGPHWDGHSLRVPGFTRIATRPLDELQTLRKAIFDRVGAFVLIVLLAIPLVLVALLIKLDSRGPVLFRQPRVGFNNRLFVVYKFRTMYHDRADLLCDVQTTRGDERVTRVGFWLRRLSIDELPQLINVLNGSMALVGPRPHAPNTKAEGRPFASAVSEYARRHRVKPGITGWAQVNGWRGETKSINHLEQRVNYDLEYIENWSVALDLKIILLTLIRVTRSSNAY